MARRVLRTTFFSHCACERWGPVFSGKEGGESSALGGASSTTVEIALVRRAQGHRRRSAAQPRGYVKIEQGEAGDFPPMTPYGGRQRPQRSPLDPKQHTRPPRYPQRQCHAHCFTLAPSSLALSTVCTPRPPPVALLAAPCRSVDGKIPNVTQGRTDRHLDEAPVHHACRG